MPSLGTRAGEEVGSREQGGSDGAWVGEGYGGGKVLGGPCYGGLVEAPPLVAWLGPGDDLGLGPGACEEIVSGV